MKACTGTADDIFAEQIGLELRVDKRMVENKNFSLHYF